MRKSTRGLVLHNTELRDYSPAFRAHYHVYVSNANMRGIPFKLTITEFAALTYAPCYYCGTDPEPRVFGSMKYTDKLNGLDREDPDGGYTRYNAVPCCKPCNRIKHYMTPKEYIEHAHRIVAFHRGNTNNS